MKSYTQFLIKHYDRLHKEFSSLEHNAKVIRDERDSQLEINPSTNVRSMNKFLVCVDGLNKNADKRFSQLFSSTPQKLERASTSIEKMKDVKDDKTRKRKIDRVIVNLLPHYAKNILRSTLRVTDRNCYSKFDEDSIKTEKITFTQVPFAEIR